MAAPVKVVSSPAILTCPECDKKFRGPTRGRMLGAHRWHVHNIKGTSYSSTTKRRLKARAAVQSHPALGRAARNSDNDLVCKECGKGPFKNAFGLVIHTATIHSPKGARHTNGTSTSNTDAEIALAHWLGKLTASVERDIEVVAARVGFTREEITSRFVAILSGKSKTLRQRYRLPDSL